MTEEAINPPVDSLELAEWLLWLERLDPSKIEFGLERVRSIYERLPKLSSRTKVVTIAGTNGKGSCVGALQQAAVALGKKVVSFSSPHLLHYNERVQIQGEPAADAELVSVFQKIARRQKQPESQDGTHLTYFEYGALAALVVAAERQPDLLILEVGLGGRLDAVNIIDADIVVITAIGMDHMDWLGNDLESIAFEKCGVLRKNIPVVLAAPDMPEAVYQAAKEKSVELYAWGEAFEISPSGMNTQKIRIGDQIADLTNVHLHPQSIGAAAMVIELLWPQNLSEIANSLQSAQLLGRFQRLQIGSRDVILDVAHNPMSAANLCNRLEEEGITKVDLVFAMMADKDVEPIVELLAPLANNWYLLNLENSRALVPTDLADLLDDFGIEDVELINLDDSKISNQLFIGKSEQIPLLVTGSFYTVSAILEHAERQAPST